MHFVQGVVTDRKRNWGTRIVPLAFVASAKHSVHTHRFGNGFLAEKVAYHTVDRVIQTDRANMVKPCEPPSEYVCLRLSISQNG